MNAKKKGNAGENNWSNFLTSKGIKAYKNASSGANIQKSDVHNSIGYNFEVKTVKRLNLQEAWKQTCRDASMSHTTPSLVIHFDGMPKDEWLVVLHSNDWLDLILGEIEEVVPQFSEQKQRSISYKLENAKRSVKELLKEIENE